MGPACPFDQLSPKGHLDPEDRPTKAGGTKAAESLTINANDAKKTWLLTGDIHVGFPILSFLFLSPSPEFPRSILPQNLTSRPGILIHMGVISTHK